jgi:hypothetical protein
VDVGQYLEGSTINPNLNCSLDGKGTQDSSPLELVKYILRPTSKGTLDFPGKVTRDLRFFEETIPKSNQRGKKS